MNAATEIAAVTSSPSFKGMIKPIMEGLKEIGIATGTHVFLNRRTRGGGEPTSSEKNKYYDEGVLLRAYADLANQLKSFGQPADEVNRIIGEVAKFFSDPNLSTPKEAETFRLSIAAMALEDIDNVWRQLLLFAEAEPAEKKALAAQLARPALFDEWFTRTYIEASRTWEKTIRSLPQAEALTVHAFLRTLGPIEGLQFTLSLGRIEDDAERLRLMREVLNPPAGITSLDLAQARGLINFELARRFKDWMGRGYHQLETAYTDWLTSQAPAIQAWSNRQIHTAQHPPWWDIVGRAINRLFR